MRKRIGLAIMALAILSSTLPTQAAEYDTQPLLTFNNVREVNQATYSSLGRYMPGESKYISYDSRDFTDFDEAMPDGQKGIPIVISVSDPDDGQVLKARVTVQGNSYNIHWKSLDGGLLGETGEKIAGFAFIPIADLDNTASDQIQIVLENYENAGDTSPLSSLTASATIAVDRQAPVANVTAANNSITVDSVSELPCKLMVQLKDDLGNWNPPVETMITSVPTSYSYDSLWHPSVSVRYWVEDMLGNRSIDSENDLTTPNDKLEYIGRYDDNRAVFAAYINTRLGSAERLNDRYFAFIGGLL